MKQLENLERGVANKLNIDDISALEIKKDDTVFHDNQEEDAADDYKFIRKKIKKAVLASETVLEQALKYIQINPGPRVVEGCSQIIRIMIDASEKLQNMHEKQSKINEKNQREKPSKEEDNTKIKSKLTDILDELGDS